MFPKLAKPLADAVESEGHGDDNPTAEIKGLAHKKPALLVTVLFPHSLSILVTAPPTLNLSISSSSLPPWGLAMT
ncbi:hypothetical protein PGTUg99_017206 [Puccinia graminis f. sp. tritici]|uniref:Uncharacterized protein n=1 Tax=Puccinia graminis f. sp. tritici TaxID=56615 RepID=A0A5B0NJ36_PUCGR|nr:hypothetical protein PGTUg99_017206 [Puccinia graminis f. sp. tritici]